MEKVSVKYFHPVDGNKIERRVYEFLNSGSGVNDVMRDVFKGSLSMMNPELEDSVFNQVSKLAIFNRKNFSDIMRKNIESEAVINYPIPLMFNIGQFIFEKIRTYNNENYFFIEVQKTGIKIPVICKVFRSKVNLSDIIIVYDGYLIKASDQSQIKPNIALKSLIPNSSNIRRMSMLEFKSLGNVNEYIQEDGYFIDLPELSNFDYFYRFITVIIVDLLKNNDSDIHIRINDDIDYQSLYNIFLYNIEDVKERLETYSNNGNTLYSIVYTAFNLNLLEYPVYLDSIDVHTGIASFEVVGGFLDKVELKNSTSDNIEYIFSPMKLNDFIATLKERISLLLDDNTTEDINSSDEETNYAQFLLEQEGLISCKEFLLSLDYDDNNIEDLKLVKLVESININDISFINNILSIDIDKLSSGGLVIYDYMRDIYNDITYHAINNKFDIIKDYLSIINGLIGNFSQSNIEKIINDETSLKGLFNVQDKIIDIKNKLESDLKEFRDAKRFTDKEKLILNVSEEDFPIFHNGTGSIIYDFKEYLNNLYNWFYFRTFTSIDVSRSKVLRFIRTLIDFSPSINVDLADIAKVMVGITTKLLTSAANILGVMGHLLNYFEKVNFPFLYNKDFTLKSLCYIDYDDYNDSDYKLVKKNFIIIPNTANKDIFNRDIPLRDGIRLFKYNVNTYDTSIINISKDNIKFNRTNIFEVDDSIINDVNKFLKKLKDFKSNNFTKFVLIYLFISDKINNDSELFKSSPMISLSQKAIMTGLASLQSAIAGANAALKGFGLIGRAIAAAGATALVIAANAISYYKYFKEHDVYEYSVIENEVSLQTKELFYTDIHNIPFLPKTIFDYIYDLAELIIKLGVSFAGSIIVSRAMGSLTAKISKKSYKIKVKKAIKGKMSPIAEKNSQEFIRKQKEIHGSNYNHYMSYNYLQNGGSGDYLFNPKTGKPIRNTWEGKKSYLSSLINAGQSATLARDLLKSENLENGIDKSQESIDNPTEKFPEIIESLRSIKKINKSIKRRLK